MESVGKHIVGFFTLIILLCFLSLNTKGQLADTPWPSFQNGIKNTGLSEYQESEASGLKWKSDIASGARAPIMGDDGIMYSLGPHLYAIDPYGKKKWQFEFEGMGSWSAAVGNNGTIYFASSKDTLYAVSSEGNLKWHFEFDNITASTPIIGRDGTIYVLGMRYLYALNPDGSQKWRFRIEEWMTSTTPAIGMNETIYFAASDGVSDKDSGGYLYALNQDGSLKWKFGIKRSVLSSPTIGINGNIYIGTLNGYVYSVNPDGKKRWRFDTSADLFQSVAIGPKGTIYVTAGGLYALKKDGNEKWHFRPEQHISNTSSPAVSANGTIYVGGDNILYALNPDGSEKWIYKTQGDVDSSPMVGVNGTIYCRAGNSLYAIYGGTRTDISDERIVPNKYKLEQNSPNPFNPSTKIAFELSQVSSVQLDVFNVKGQKVAELIDGRRRAGKHTVRFDGEGLSSGMYFYRLKTGQYSETRKMILLE